MMFRNMSCVYNMGTIDTLCELLSGIKEDTQAKISCVKN